MSLQEYVNMGIHPLFPYKKINVEKDTEISIGITEHTLFITFLGSVSIKDWLNNFRFWKKPYRDMSKPFYVHAGFCDIYKTLRDYIHEYLCQHRDEFNKIIITGHSLGGAIATLCHEDIKFLQETGKVSPSITLITKVSGTPRVFSLFFSKVPRQRCADITRIIYGNDGIPTLPPVFLGYRHVGKMEQVVKKRFPLLLIPSFVYHHSVRQYEHLDKTIKNDSNELYNIAMKIYSIGYACLFIFVLALIMVICNK